MCLKDAVFICLQSAHGPICPWDDYPTYSMYCTSDAQLLYSIAQLLRNAQSLSVMHSLMTHAQ